jgi:aerobic-type carbon monoxide dehydrogenase small subunit (CoxS/CutS family)
MILPAHSVDAHIRLNSCGTIGHRSRRLRAARVKLRYHEPRATISLNPHGIAMGEYTLNINGKSLQVSAPAEESLLSVLRNRLDLTGTKYGCGEGQCGACTVLLNGQATRSCLTPVNAVAGAKVVTIEGLERDGRLTPVQEAFLEEGAFQCGYCTSGMIMSATSLLNEEHDPTDEKIIAGMNGNVCRCGTYPRIVQAVKLASRLAAQEAKNERR